MNERVFWCEFEALICEREGMRALNREREDANMSLAYDESAFLALAERFRALPKDAQPNSTQQTQYAGS